MSPIDELQALYHRYSPERDLEVDMGYFIRYGYVVATPEFVLMGKAIKRGAKWELINDPTYIFPKRQQDTWFVSAYAGRIKVLLDFWPYPLTWLAWQRQGGCLRYWTFERFRKHVEFRSFT